MKVYDQLEQGTDEWLKLKSGIISASEIGMWVAKEKRCTLTIPQIKAILTDQGIDYAKTAKKSELEPLLPIIEPFMEHTHETKEAQMKLICLKLAERSGEEMQPFYSNWSMDRGMALEPEARAAYELESGNEVEQVGFVMHDNGMMGVSPDGFINNRKSGVEIKTPLPQTHVKYLLEGTLPDEYQPQLAMQMAICEWDYCDFYSYSPSLPSLMIRIKRDEFTQAILAGLLVLCEDYKKQMAVMAGKWDQMKKRLDPNSPTETI